MNTEHIQYETRGGKTVNAKIKISRRPIPYTIIIYKLINGINHLNSWRLRPVIIVMDLDLLRVTPVMVMKNFVK